MCFTQLIHDNSFHVYEPIRLCEREIISHASTHTNTARPVLCVHTNVWMHMFPEMRQCAVNRHYDKVKPCSPLTVHKVISGGNKRQKKEMWDSLSSSLWCHNVSQGSTPQSLPEGGAQTLLSFPIAVLQLGFNRYRFVYPHRIDHC